MKVSENWLREWINTPLSIKEICERLTMSGLEVESCDPIAEKFHGVIIAEVLNFKKHPDSEKLSICEVKTNSTKTLSIVCGAQNIKFGMKAALALVGAQLPKEKTITESNIRGISSQGMLCSAAELGLEDQTEGLLHLPKDAPLGKDLWEYLHLTDNVIDISITPNRGDCLSLLGLSHEVAAILDLPHNKKNINKTPSQFEKTTKISIEAPSACPRYIGRPINNVKADAATPIWLKEKLRRSGIRTISPIVDVTNYVMLELGQPMHAFDADKIHGNIKVCFAKNDATVDLLDGSIQKLDDKTLTISDDKNVLALAGVMGGLDSSVTLLTKNIFLESAFFNAQVVARQTRFFNINSESSYRFERGIDPTLQRLAMERATELILEICGGTPGPIIEEVYQDKLPHDANIILRYDRIKKILGFEINQPDIEKILTRLQFSFNKIHNGWEVIVPAKRSDITLEVDLIEEIIRLYGYDALPTHKIQGQIFSYSVSEKLLNPTTIRHYLRDMNYHEVVTYSFLDKKIQHLFNANLIPKELVNPINNEMSVMRTSLLPGLVNVLLYNQNRQQSRIRIFEIGLNFIPNQNEIIQQAKVAGLVSGCNIEEQWSEKPRPTDFFDLKGDLEKLFKLTFSDKSFIFKTGQHPSLHPGQTAEIFRNNQKIGIIGALHPKISQELNIQEKVFVFELDLDSLLTAKVPVYKEVSKFPEIRRDIAIIVDQHIMADILLDTIKEISGNLLQKIDIFDLYKGKGIPEGQKSIAFALTLQHSSRTLRDEEIAELMDKIVVTLKDKFSAELRG